MVISRIYPRTISEIVAGTFGWTSSNFRTLLLTPDAAYNRSHQFVSSLVNNELTQASRANLNPNSPVVNNNNQFIFGANDVIFSAQNSGQTIGAVAVYRFVTTDANSPLVAFIYGLNSQATKGLSVTIPFAAAGVFGLEIGSPSSLSEQLLIAAL